MLSPEKHTFDTIWGHDGPRKVVPRLLAAGRLPHAIMLTGPDAIGKRSLAFAMAKAILSAGLPTEEVSISAPGPAPAKRQVPGEEPDGMDLFGDTADQDDLFGEEPDLFGEIEKEEPASKAKLNVPIAASATPPGPPKPEPTKKMPNRLKATFTGYDPRVCRLVEAGYPIEHDKEGRPTNGAHPDLTIVEPVGGRRGIVVNQMRHLHQLVRPPIEGAFRVVLVFGADTITQEGGNSILKLLEEPPRYLVMILVANQLNHVLPTIRSRCSIIPMSPLPKETLEEKLVEEERLARPVAQVATSLSEGRPGVALQAIAADLLQRRNDVFQARLQLDRFGQSAVCAAAARIQTKGPLEDSLWLLLSFARDRMVRTLVPDRPDLIVHQDALDLVDQAKTKPEDLDAEADRILDSYDLLGHPYLPNLRAALQTILWKD
jgi:DNA polymerase III subunit delta'